MQDDDKAEDVSIPVQDMPPDPFTPITVKVYDLRSAIPFVVIAFGVGYFFGRFIEWVTVNA
jgi:hypothetical protein